jgi:hypothetical protein
VGPRRKLEGNIKMYPKDVRSESALPWPVSPVAGIPNHSDVYSLKSTNNNAEVLTLCDTKLLRRPPFLLHVSVACIPPSSGREISSWRLRLHL